MADDIQTIAVYVSLAFLAGLAFGIFVKIFGSAELIRWRMNSVDETEHACAEEGDLTIHRKATK